jgi:hypothetical protein
MLEVLYKIPSRILAARLNRILPTIIGPHQHGFITQKGIQEPSLLATHLIQDSTLYSKPLQLVSFDMEKAFDRVGHAVIIQALRAFGVPEIMVHYAETLLTGFLKLRNELIRILVTAGITKFKVFDTCCTTSCATTANAKTRLTDLKNVTAKDGLHYVAAGYQNLATRSLSCLRSLTSAPPWQFKQVSHFWRGFSSTRGLKRAMVSQGSHARGRGGHKPSHARGFHPYRRN